MASEERWSVRRARWLNRYHARRAGLGPVATGFVSQPEPRTIGSFARGGQLVAGNFLFAGYLVEAPETPIWDLPVPDDAFEQSIHGFRWLDDLAAHGTRASRQRAQAWTHHWVALYGNGDGPGWTPDLTGRRLVRWINNAILLLNGASRDENRAFFRALSRQTRFLARRWRAASPGLPRIEALTGLIYAGLSLEGMQRHVRPAVQALDRECRKEIGTDGGIPSRNPEELLEVFSLLTWNFEALAEEGRSAGPALLAAIEAISPTLRALRHGDGGLARFHGGGRGQDGRLEHALATAGIKTIRGRETAMGFIRLSHGRTTVIADAAPPPSGEASVDAHASTLAIEISSGRRPLIVNCGAGASFGKSWRRAGRATPSHSTLCLDGKSSSRLSAEDDLLLSVPKKVRIDWRDDDEGSNVILAHDGYEADYGLTHVRSLRLGFDGRSLAGEDALGALSDAAKATFDKALDRAGLEGVPFAIRFHLHPEADARLDMGGSAVSVSLKSGEIWVFRHDGRARLALEPTVYLDSGRLTPRTSKQIVLHSAAFDYATRIDWTLSKAQDTPSHVRDFAVDEPLVAD